MLVSVLYLSSTGRCWSACCTDRVTEGVGQRLHCLILVCHLFYVFLIADEIGTLTDTRRYTIYTALPGRYPPIHNIHSPPRSILESDFFIKRFPCAQSMGVCRAVTRGSDAPTVPVNGGVPRRYWQLVAASLPRVTALCCT